MATGGIQGQLLEITVVGCTRLRDTEWISRQDPYVCLEYANSKFRTKTCTDGGKNPTFNEKFVLPLIEGLRDINVSVWNSNILQFDDLIGTGRILLQKVLSSGYDDTSWTLTSRRGKNAGEVRIILHYTNTGKNKAQSAPYAPPYTGQLSTSTPYAPPMGYLPIQQQSTAYSGYPPIQQPSTAYSGYPPMTAYKSEPTTAYPPQSNVYPPPQSNVYPPPRGDVYPPPPSDVYPSPSSHYHSASSAYASPFGTPSPSPFAPAVYPPPSPFAPAVYPPPSPFAPAVYPSQPYAGHYPGVYPPQ